jgi:hypothetical protein
VEKCSKHGNFMQITASVSQNWVQFSIHFQSIAERVDYTKAPPQGDIWSAGSMSQPRGVCVCVCVHVHVPVTLEI